MFCYLEAIALNDNFATFFSALIIAFFYFVFAYIFHMRDLNICRFEVVVQTANEKICSIVDTSPDCITVIDENMQTLFLNKNFKKLIKDRTAIEYFLHSEYHKRNYNHTDSDQIVLDMKDSFSRNFENDISFGIIHKDDELTD